MIFTEKSDEIDETEIINDIKKLKKEGFSNKDISKIIPLMKNAPKNKVYELALKQ